MISAAPLSPPGVVGQSWTVPMQMAQLEEGRAYMATSPRDPQVFLHLCFSSLPWRLTLIPVGGAGSLHSLVTLVCQLGVTTTVISPYSNYSFTI